VAVEAVNIPQELLVRVVQVVVVLVELMELAEQMVMPIKAQVAVVQVHHQLALVQVAMVDLE
jgi:hypothetical protein